MENAALTAIMIFADEETAGRAAVYLHTLGISAANVGRAVQATKRYQVVGDLPNTAPKKDCEKALFETLMGEIKAEEEFKNILEPMDATYIIMNDMETDPTISIRDMVTACGVNGLFSAIVETTVLSHDLTSEMMDLFESGEDSDKVQRIEKQISALSMVLNFSRKVLFQALIGQA